MPALIDIRRRIRSVRNTEQITKAMKMVSAAKLRRAQEAMFAARPYAHRMEEVLKSLAARTDPESHPLLRARRGDKTLLGSAAASTPTSCVRPCAFSKSVRKTARA